MSLSLTNDKDSQIIAYLIKNDKPKTGIYYMNDDKLDDRIVPLKKIKLNKSDESFFPSVTDFKKTNNTDRVFISGPSGTGKTTFVAQYVKMFKLKYPKAKIFLFSSKNEDKILDDLKYIERVTIDDDILIQPYTLQDITDDNLSLVIFDDIEDFSNKKITNQIQQFRDEVIRNGRSRGIYCCYINHDPCNYKMTKQQIFEATKVIIFPKKCGQGTYNYLLQNKLHLPKKLIEIILNAKSNFVCVNKALPQFILADKYIVLQ